MPLLAIRPTAPLAFWVIIRELVKKGIKYVSTKVKQTKVHSEAKTYLTKKLDVNKWNHILNPKHKWPSVGATSKGKVADLMARAMAYGKHLPYKNGKSAWQAQWIYRGKTIVVTYSKTTGKISNGWVR